MLAEVRAPRNAFAGRDADLSALDRLVDEGAVSILVHGAAGVGKTRLALEWAARRGFARVVFCDLSVARDEASAWAAVARGLDLEGTQLAPAAVMEHLREHPAVLLLDELDHVPELGASIARLLATVSGVLVLATSQRRTRSIEQTCLTIGPLPRETAARLVAARALALGIEIALDDPSMAPIVRATEGVPLAIELATARLVVMTPAQLAERLHDPLTLLRAERRGRHATVERTVRWALALLAPSARSALEQCTIFEDELDLDAAEAVLVVRGATTLDLVQTLVECSLLSARTEGPTRLFRMSSIVREVARPDTHDSRVIERHARHFLARAALEGPPAVVRRARIELAGALRSRSLGVRARAEIELALTPFTLSETGAGEHARALVSLERKLRRARHVRLANEVALRRVRALELAGEIDAASRLCASLRRRGMDSARLDHAAASLGRRRGDFRRVRELLERARNACGGGALRAQIARDLAVADLMAGDLERAEAHLLEARDAHVEAGRAWAEANARIDLGALLLDRDADARAAAELEAALRIHGAFGDQRRANIARSNLAVATHLRGDLDAAAAHAEEALREHVRTGARRFAAFTRVVRATIDHERGRLADAARELSEAMAVFESIDDRAYLGWARSRSALLRLERDGPEAARLVLANAASALEGVPRRWWQAGMAVTSAAIEGRAAPPHEPTSWARLASRVARSIAARTAATTSVLVLAPDGVWFELDGRRVTLARRRVLARMLGHLADQRVAAPGRAVTVDELVDATWPGERMRVSSAQARVYATIRALRRLGLDGALVTSGGGYLVHTSVAVGASRG
jgi:predicted ATPase